jgi:hypothetical protein
MALTEGVGKAYVSLISAKNRMATFLGVYQMVLDICHFLFLFLQDYFWNYYSVQAPFIFGSIMAIIATFLFIVLEKK